jgi:hypothetical protein
MSVLVNHTFCSTEKGVSKVGNTHTGRCCKLQGLALCNIAQQTVSSVYTDQSTAAVVVVAVAVIVV